MHQTIQGAAFHLVGQLHSCCTLVPLWEHETAQHSAVCPLEFTFLNQTHLRSLVSLARSFWVVAMWDFDCLLKLGLVSFPSYVFFSIPHASLDRECFFSKCFRYLQKNNQSKVNMYYKIIVFLGKYKCQCLECCLCILFFWEPLLGERMKDTGIFNEL